MQTITPSRISETVARLVHRAETMLPPEIGMKIECAFEKPAESAAGKAALFALLEHFTHCGLTGTRLCPNTETVVVHAACGEACNLSEAVLSDAIRAGLNAAYCDRSPQPAFVLHLTRVPGSTLHLKVQPRSGIVSFSWSPPESGMDAKVFTGWLMQTFKQQQHTLSFPVFLGLGISTVAHTAKALADTALLQYMDQTNPSPDYAALETRILLASQHLGFGPNGAPGRQTVLGVSICADTGLDTARCCTVRVAPALLRRAEATL